MKIENIINAISKNHPGSFFRISYNTELPVKASYKKEGIKIYKHTNKTVRTGCSYKNIKDIPTARGYGNPVNYEWVMKNSVSYNKNTHKFYLSVYPTERGCNVRSAYTIFRNGMPEVTFDVANIKDYVIDSYWNKGNPSKKQMISADNISKISFKGKVYE